MVPAADGRTHARMKLLDSGEILEEPTQKKDNPRRKPLPATYEPGTHVGLLSRPEPVGSVS